MPDRLKYIQVIFSDDGLSIKREYKSVHFEGEGSPREVEITPEERLELYGAAHAVSTAILSDAETAKTQALAQVASLQSEIATKAARITELEAALVAAQTPPPAVSVSRMQALLALHDAGLLDAVNAIIAQADARTKLAWETATDFHRDSPTIITLWTALGKTEAELDALFIAASSIRV